MNFFLKLKKFQGSFWRFMIASEIFSQLGGRNVCKAAFLLMPSVVRIASAIRPPRARMTKNVSWIRAWL